MRINDSLNQSKTERRITEQGYLVVPANLSKVGVFRYRESELRKDGSTDIKTVARTENSLFTDATINSFENAPITITHPKGDVTADNWKELSVGFVRNVRREGDFLKGDAWVTDKSAIRAIQDNGLVEISCGYDAEVLPATDGADYEFAPMKGNHVALVPAGRCGSDVKIHDEDTIAMDKEQLKELLKGLSSDELQELIGEVTAEDNQETETTETETETTTEPQGDEQVDEQETTDLQAENEQLKATIAELQQKLKELQDAQDEVEAENTATQVRDFMPDFVAENAKTAREVKRQALVKAGTHNVQQVAKLTDAALDASFDVMKALSKGNKQSNKATLGKGIKDSALDTGNSGNVWGGRIDLNKRYGGK